MAQLQPPPDLNQLAAAQDWSPVKVSIVVSSYNDAITGKLLEGAEQTCRQVGIVPQNLTIVTVPGAWELGLGCLRELSRGAAGVIALGCVIRGETTHDQHINAAVSQALMGLSLRFERPVGFGLLTVNTLEQAQARAGGAVGNKGIETAAAVLQMIF